MNLNTESNRNSNYFNVHTELVFFTITLFLLISGTLLVAFSNRFIPLLYDFLSQKIFHREFSIDKWLPSLQSFFLIPLFLTITINALYFYKHSDKFKIIYLSSILFCIAFFVFYTVLVGLPNFIEGDLASETLLARECVREKSFIPFGWGYSTEIRLLNTQLISAPLFIFIHSWNMVRALTSILSCAVLFWASWFLLSRIGISKLWLKMLSSTLLVCPWSNLHFYVIGWGNYYIPHIVLGFVTLAVFIPILNGSSKNIKISIFAFYLLSFISGVSTIRYILIYQFPLFLAVLVISSSKEKKINSFIDLKDFIISNKALLHCLIALVISGLGYVFNNLVLHSLYNFSQWNDVKFNSFGDITIQSLFTTIIRAFGYQENVAVFTPSGVINIFVYIALSFFIINIVLNLKSSLSNERKLLLIFTLSTIGFNTFLYYHTEFIGRFYITILAYMIPCIAVFIDNPCVANIKKYGLGVFFSICIFTSSYTSVQIYLTTDANAKFHGVMKFLNDRRAVDDDYSFGYSTFDFANMVTYFSNEKIEVACVKKIHKNGHDMIPDKYVAGTWLTPLRYNSYIHNGKIFFLISEEIYSASSTGLFEAGHEVYSDGYFRVFEYESQDAFKNAFSKK